MSSFHHTYSQILLCPQCHETTNNSREMLPPTGLLETLPESPTPGVIQLLFLIGQGLNSHTHGAPHLQGCPNSTCNKTCNYTGERPLDSCMRKGTLKPQ